jgi:hypothetical protein
VSVPFESGLAFGGNRLHFPQPGDDGTCGKRINITGNGSDQRCGQSRDGDRHLHYACTVDPWCAVKSWSLEGRADHERSHSR